MGLDMYLKAEKYVSDYSFRKEGAGDIYKRLVKDFGVSDFVDKDTPSATVQFTVGYWRKENHIHRWFVENVQDGVDNCQSFYVSREALQELRGLCKQVVDGVEMKDGKLVESVTVSKEGRVENLIDGKVVANTATAEELLPTQDGFFFGGTEYDEWYVRGCQDTIEIIDRVLAMPEHWDFYYRSSW